jgi:hypothetical protein
MEELLSSTLPVIGIYSDSFANILTGTKASLHTFRSATALYAIYHFSLPFSEEQTRLNAQACSMLLNEAVKNEKPYWIWP